MDALWLVLLVLACVPHAQATAPAYEPARWNVHVNITAPHVPADLLFKPPSASNTGRALFPLTGYDVTQQCHSPSNPFNSDNERRQPGACAYGSVAGGSNGCSGSSGSAASNGDSSSSVTYYSYWEKQPGQVLRMNNCYCYALNRPSTDWCDPGASAGKSIASPAQLTCDTLRAAVIADGGVAVSKEQVFGAPAPAQGHYIKAFIRPQSACNFPRCEPDFHFMRLDGNGLWSQKLGEAPVSNVDANNQPIIDPDKAKLPAAYTQGCGYFLVVPSAMNVGYMGVPDLVARGLQRWRDAGIEYCSRPLPYDPAVDAQSPQVQLERAQALQRAEQMGSPVLQQQLSSPPPVQGGSPGSPLPQQQGRRLLGGHGHGPRALRLGVASFR